MSSSVILLIISACLANRYLNQFKVDPKSHKQRKGKLSARKQPSRTAVTEEPRSGIGIEAGTKEFHGTGDKVYSHQPAAANCHPDFHPPPPQTRGVSAFACLLVRSVFVMSTVSDTLGSIACATSTSRSHKYKYITRTHIHIHTR